VAKLEAAGIPCSAVQSVAEMIEHEQTQSLDLLKEVPETGMKFFSLPLRLNGQRTTMRSPPPKLGQHTETIFSTVNSINIQS
jgi:crotonobetainyl-CoA:carnitine CoA-transferase CaiB-like acyl-CoA transferase